MGNTKLANPAPLGLMGFGMTTILLNLHNIGMFPMDGIIPAMGIFYGGIAQIFAGLLEYKKGNTFGLTAFTSYGSFWLTLVAILLMPKMGWRRRQTPISACTGTVGRVHPVHVLWHPQGEPRAAIRLPEPDRPVRPAGHRSRRITKASFTLPAGSVWFAAQAQSTGHG